MNYLVKNKNQICKIKQANKIVVDTLEMIEEYIKPGICTETINNICHKYIISKKAVPAVLNYCGFPKSICTSLNEVVCHGIPNYNDILKPGDILNIDIVVMKNNFYGDSSKMYFVPPISKIVKKLCFITKQSLYAGIKILKPGIKINKIGKTIENYVNKFSSYSIVKNYCGHGIGKQMHEQPNILHYKNNNQDILLEGMIITIEPMLNLGKADVYIDNDNWTVKTQDNQLSAQYEHSILITNNSYEILTLREEETKFFH